MDGDFVMNSRVVGPVVVSVLVLVMFGGALALALTRIMPAGSENILTALLGTLGTLAGLVVNYWMGSSAGSVSKQADLMTMSTLAASQVPAELVAKP